MKVNIFLDLEGTVIEQWQQFPTWLPTQTDAIKTFLGTQAVREVSIFSFAIHTDEEVEQFHTLMKKDMEAILCCKVVNVVSVPQMQEASERINKVRFFDVSDFIQLRGKELAFHDWCHRFHVGQQSFLIDDVVPNRTTVDHDTKTIAETLNVNHLWRNQ